MSVSVWFRVIRIKFLLASVISVSLGLAISYWQTRTIDIMSAVITMGGVVALHSSVDLLNDYWDFKRGIDSLTKRTKFSGGTGVLPEGLLKPSSVYFAGIVFLVLGSVAGLYFVIIHGWVIAVILAFAVLSIYFYSTKIVDSGLGEVFVGIKGTMIVLGTIYIQTNEILLVNVLSGIIAGTLSSFVLFLTSFPDYEADKQKGRKTLVILLGKYSAAKLFWIFPGLLYGIIITGVAFGIFPNYSLITLGAIPLLLRPGKKIIFSIDQNEKFETIMKSSILFSRITGVLFALGFVLSFVNNS